MKLTQLWVGSLVFAVLAVLTVRSAYADTFVAQTIYNGQAEVYAIDDYGDYTLLFSSLADDLPAGCTYGAGSSCFLTHYYGSTGVLISTTAPTLPDDLSPKAGPGCVAAPVGYDFFSCLNGHPYYTNDEHGLYSAPNVQSFITGGNPTGTPKESASGNLLYYTGEDTEVLVLDTTTLATTPEPSSFALLGTGLLGALGIARKRFA